MKAYLLQWYIHSRSIQHVVDSTLHFERSFVDSLALSTTVHVGKASRELKSLTDSLIISAADSLDDSRKDSLRVVAGSLEQQMVSVEAETRKLLSGLLLNFTKQLDRGKTVYSPCDGCQSTEDFEAQLGNFRDVVDSLRGSFRDTASSLRDDQSETFRDRLESYRDSLVQVREDLIDHRLDEIDVQRYRASRFIVSTGYSSHNSYRGRDNSIPQQMILPTIEYRHSSGLSIAASTFWFDKTPKKWSDFLLSAGYNSTIGNVVDVSVSYTHFWFSDSSKTARSVFTDEASAGLSIDWPVLSLGTNASLDIGSANEFTLMTSASHSFEIPLSLYNRITIEPMVTATVGQQNSELTILRRKSAKGKKVVGIQTQVNNSFGILDYEATLPVTIELGQVTLAPALTYIIPLNVVDQSTASGFFDFDLTISLSLR